MKNSNNLKLILTFLAALIFQNGYAQTEYGNGSQLISGSRYQTWDINKNDWVNYDSLKYEYHTNNKPLLITQRKFDKTTQKWYVNGYTVYTYDQSGNALSYVDSTIDPQYYHWRTKVISQFNPDNTEKRRTRYIWHSDSSVWQSKMNSYFGYNSSGLQNLYWEEIYSEYRKAMVPQVRYSYTYNGNGLYDVILSESWDTLSGQWKMMYRTSSVYTSTQKELMYKGEEYINNTWVNSHKVEYNYNSDDQISSRIDYKWDAGISDWVASFKNSFYYDDKKQLEAVVSSKWNKNTSKWENYSSTQYGLDFFGRPSSYLYSQWDASAAKWVYNTKRASKFDNVGYETSRETQNWDKSGNVFVNVARQYWSYQLKNTAVVKKITGEKGILKLYPNPASDRIHLELPESMGQRVFITVYNCSGQAVVDGSLMSAENGSITLSLNRNLIREGTYIISVTDGNQRVQSGIIIR